MALAAELTIGQVSARSGVAASAIRFYEELGLVSSSRTDGNQRRFDRGVLRRLAFIQAGRAAGIPLETIRLALFGLPGDRTPTKRDWARLSAGWRHDLDARIATLEDIRDRLTSCIGCGCLSLRSCRLFNPDDGLGATEVGAPLLHT